ncbi:hypothetical protein SEPCBS119000_001543 [Sporothrix epigloea]|uniref:Uncharacterized protein n=1 Tax=Sporothrix epigloea TaxID=1892477 RepID=A0ABP0DBD3_9PEZI
MPSSLLRRESSLGDALTFPSTPAMYRTGVWSQSQTPLETRQGSGTPYDHYKATPVHSISATDNLDEPPPRRELPQSITRHISQPSSQTGVLASRTSEPTRKVAVAEVEVQTEQPFVEPKEALLAGMGLFQELSTLKDSLIKECLSMTKLLGGDNETLGQAEARLAARYAIEFQSRFVEICGRHAQTYLA